MEETFKKLMENILTPKQDEIFITAKIFIAANISSGRNTSLNMMPNVESQNIVDNAINMATQLYEKVKQIKD